jgi:hypothetical protein
MEVTMNPQVLDQAIDQLQQQGAPIRPRQLRHLLREQGHPAMYGDIYTHLRAQGLLVVREGDDIDDTEVTPDEPDDEADHRTY